MKDSLLSNGQNFSDPSGIDLAQEGAQGLHQQRSVRVGLVEQFIELAFGLLTPLPGILEGLDLRFALTAFRRAKLNFDWEKSRKC